MTNFNSILEAMTSALVVATFNSARGHLTGDDVPAPVNKFADKKTGIKRTSALLDRLVAQVGETGSVGLSSEGVVTIVGDELAEADKPKPEPVAADKPKPEPVEADKPKPEPVAADKPKPEPVEADKPKPEPVEADKPKPEPAEADKPKPEPVEVTKPAETTDEPKRRRQRAPGSGRPPTVSDADVIVLLLPLEKNPKRAAARIRFNKYKAQQTFGEYTAAIGGDRKQALRDVVWDSKQGWIRIVGAAQAKREEEEAAAAKSAA